MQIFRKIEYKFSASVALRISDVGQFSKLQQRQCAAKFDKCSLRYYNF